MKTLKYEEVYLFEYEDFAEAKRRIGQFLDRVYNEKRLHSAARVSPAGRVRANFVGLDSGFGGGGGMSFPRHEESFDPMGGVRAGVGPQSERLTPRPIVSMSFRPVIPLAGCAPAEPAPLHRPRRSLQ